MKSYHVLFIVFICLQSCCYPQIDIREAKQIVHLDSVDLAYFSSFRQQLLNDSAAIREDYERLYPPYWTTAASYSLNQIDSAKYGMFFLKLKGKIVDGIRMNMDGCVIFKIKSNTQMHYPEQHETYIHQLFSADCDCSYLRYVDTLFVDSVINKDWRYVFYKDLTGW